MKKAPDILLKDCSKCFYACRTENSKDISTMSLVCTYLNTAGLTKTPMKTILEDAPSAASGLLRKTLLTTHKKLAPSWCCKQ